ncbi:MAG: hypothetical protein ACYC2T_08140 [Bacillota bacterium]
MEQVLLLGAVVLSVIFAGMLLVQFWTRHKLHQILWTIAFLMFGFATFAEFYAEHWGWTVPLYQWYYVAAAALVALLGAGSLFLLYRKTLAYIFLAYVVIFTGLMLYRSLNAEILVSAFAAGGIVAGEAMSQNVRILAPVLTIPGSLALFGGALYSWIKTRGMYNVYIAVGTIIIAGTGGMARFGLTNVLYAGKILGLILLFYGFLKSREVVRPAVRQTLR